MCKNIFYEVLYILILILTPKDIYNLLNRKSLMRKQAQKTKKLAQDHKASDEWRNCKSKQNLGLKTMLFPLVI